VGLSLYIMQYFTQSYILTVVGQYDYSYHMLKLLILNNHCCQLNHSLHLWD